MTESEGLYLHKVYISTADFNKVLFFTNNEFVCWNWQDFVYSLYIYFQFINR